MSSALYEPIESPDESTIFSYHDLDPPTTADLYRARGVIRQHLSPTPLVRCESLSEELGADVWIKREDTLPTGAFKVRGGIHLLSGLDEEFCSRGVITASTGNHGQSIAYAGRRFDVTVRIVVPEEANPGKTEAIERLGATLIRHGGNFDEAREQAERLAAREGYRYIHSANEPALIAGVATAGLEILEEQADVDVVFVPVGGGSGACGYALTLGSLADARIIGVQSEAAPAMHRAWSQGHLRPHPRMETFAEGLATRVPFALTQQILRDRLDDMLLVSDRLLEEEIVRMLKTENLLMEGAAAAGPAALRQRADRLRGKTILFPLTGRNLSFTLLRRLVSS